LKRGKEEQEEFERNFFTRLKLQNGVYKTTHSRRFVDLNELVDQLFPSDRPLNLMDVAASSGVSTMEWVEHLNSRNIRHCMVAGDLTVKAFLISIGKNLKILIDSSGYPLQYDIFGHSVTNSECYPVARRITYAIPVYLANLAFRVFWYFSSSLKRYVEGGEDHYTSFAGVSCQPLAVISPRLQKSHSIDFIEDDIISDNNPQLLRSFHAIRAANILNKSYFDEENLNKILSVLASRLRDHGLLIICRTDLDGVNHATIFMLTDDGSFEIVSELGGGTEVVELVLNLF